jgi:hypothetical protein
MNKKFELLRKLAQEARQNPNLILPTNYGYLAYGQFKIEVKEDQVAVTYPGTQVAFTSDKVALAYCTLIRHWQFTDASVLQMIDAQLDRVKTELLLRLGKFEANPYNELNIVKLDNLRFRRQELLEEIAKYINRAKYWQDKGHDNETSRIKHTRQQENRKSNGTALWQQSSSQHTSTSKGSGSFKSSKNSAKRIQKHKGHSKHRKQPGLPQSTNDGASTNTTRKRKHRSTRSRHNRNNKSN